MLSFKDIVRFITILLLGLMAGLFYAYSISVNPGLAALPDKEYLMAMRSINEAIQNLWFFAAFMGLLMMLPICCWLNYSNKTAFYFMLASSLTYFIFVFGVTAFGNVPLNNQLAGFSIDSASVQSLSGMRKQFEMPWNNFHRIRSIASVFAFSLSLFSIIKENHLVNH